MREMWRCFLRSDRELLFPRQQCVVISCRMGKKEAEKSESFAACMFLIL
jgi:hypothetical protein